MQAKVHADICLILKPLSFCRAYRRFVSYLNFREYLPAAGSTPVRKALALLATAVAKRI